MPQDGVLYIDMVNVLNRWGRGNVAETARRNGRIILPSVSNHQRAGFVPMSEVVRRREMRGTTTREGGRNESREMETSAWNENDIADDTPQLTEDGFPPLEIEWLTAIEFDTVTGTPTQRVVHKKSEDQLAQCMVTIQTMTNSTIEGRAKLGMRLLDLFPRLVLGPSQLSQNALVNEIRRRCYLFNKGNWSQLWNEMPLPIPREAREAAREARESSKGYMIDDNLEFACTAVTYGRPGQAMGMMMSNGIAKNEDIAWAALQETHYEPPDDDPQLTEVETASYDRLLTKPMRPDFKEAIATHLKEMMPSLPKGIGAGPSGMRYEHLKAACGGINGLDAIVELGLKLAQGMWSDNMSAARLNALLKGTNEEDGYRPVACGEVLRRTVGKAMLKAIHTTVEHTFLKINQYAFSKDGSLTIFNQIRQLIADNPEYVVAATDEHTAFQRASRPKMKRSMMENFPDYIPFFEASYGKAAGLHYAGRKMPDEKSKHGSQQGCPWGGLAYCCAKMEDMRKLISENPDVLFLCFMDDIFMVGNPGDVAKAFKDWCQITVNAGGLPNLDKCKIYSTSDAAGQNEALQTMMTTPECQGAT
jgi:hypothetical protein